MKIGKEKFYLLSFVLSFFLFAFTQAVTAQTNDIMKPEAPVKVFAEDLKNAVELEAFFDNLVPKLMEKDHVPGVAISLVKDGKQLFAKGYGYANLDTGKPGSYRGDSLSNSINFQAFYLDRRDAAS